MVAHPEEIHTREVAVSLNCPPRRSSDTALREMTPAESVTWLSAVPNDGVHEIDVDPSDSSQLLSEVFNLGFTDQCARLSRGHYDGAILSSFPQFGQNCAVPATNAAG